MEINLKTEDLRPTLFQPKMARHFVLEVDGIDKYLIARVQRSCLTFEKTQSKTLQIWIHDTISPSSMQQVRQLLIESNKSDSNVKVVLKELDPVGIVISLTSWERCRATRIELPSNDYSRNDLQYIELTLALGSETFEF
jgi:hypothetical protein